MKKLPLLALSLASLLFAGEFETNLAQSVQKAAQVEVKVLSSTSLSSLNNLRLAIIQASDGSQFPLYASSDGKSFIGFSPLMSLSPEDVGRVDALMEELKGAQMRQSAEEKATLSKLFASLPKERFLFLPSSDKSVKKSLIVVSDPDCPYCKQELGNIEERLKSANIKIIFAPVHDDTAFIKSQLIMDEAKKLKESDVKGKVALLKKYFEKIELSEAQKKTDISKIKDNAAKIFGTGIITGVPFIFEEE